MLALDRIRTLAGRALPAMLGADLGPRQEEAFRRDLAETNRRRLRVVLPILVVGHLIHIAVFHLSGAERAALDPRVVEWRHGIVLCHALTLCVTAPLAVLAYRLRDYRWVRFITPIATVDYLWHGAACASVDQLTITAISPFIGYAIGSAVLAYHPPRWALLEYALGLAGFLVGIRIFQSDPSARLAIVPNGVSTTVLSVALAWLLYLARRREFLQKEVIASQQAELAALNAGLEKRVDDQVSEIVRRAQEIERLNAQLRIQVRDRSEELSLALARLALGSGEGEALRPGTVLADRFELAEVIGEGGMGTVYAALDRSSGAQVAVKVIRLESAGQLESLQRFLREARLAASVAHPGIVRVLHVDVSREGVLFQAHERVRGQALHVRLRTGHRWQPAVVARFGAVFADALSAAHAQGVVHRDVKPANVMLIDQAPGLKLLDFGIAKIFQDAVGEDLATRTGAFVGTPYFMAPEQFESGAAVTDRTDVYALGVVLFLMLTGRYPRQGRSIPELIRAHQHAGLEHLPELEQHDDIPEDLAGAILRCQLHDPGARPAAAELSAILSRIAARLGAPPLHVLERDHAVHDLDAARDHSEETLTG